MGLDQYAYTKAPDDDGVILTEDIVCWRKNYLLHDWMDVLWRFKQDAIKKDQPIEDRFIDALSPEEPMVFNNVELELDEFDIDSLDVYLEEAIVAGHYSLDDKGLDGEFIQKAREAFKAGKRVYYNSSW